MSPTASIPRRVGDRSDPWGFDALRQQALNAAQQASGELWTDYNLHDPGVTLLESLCYALTEDLYAAGQSVPELLNLPDETDEGEPAAWARFGLYTAQELLPSRPCTESDWLCWLQQQLPQARQLDMRALADARGRFSGLWRLSLQGHAEASQRNQALLRQGLQAFWGRRNLGEDLEGPPRWLRPRWVDLEVSLLLEGERDVCELLAEVLQRCDDCISDRLPDGAWAAGQGDPEAEGPLGRALRPQEAQWLRQQGALLHASDLARHLQGIAGLAAIERLRLCPAPGAFEPPQEAEPPAGAVWRRGADWALRLRWPDEPEMLQGWTLARVGGKVQLPTQALLQMLADRRRLPVRLTEIACGQPQPMDTGEVVRQALPDLPWPRTDHEAASTSLPPVYAQALREHMRQQPGLQAQWLGYLALLEQGLNQARVQREQLPRLYALDTDDLRSCWTRQPGNAQLPGVEALYRRPPEQLDNASWVDEDPLARRHRLLDYQLALHGEALDHSGLQALPCYFHPQAWPAHLLRLKRQMARRLPRLGGDRGAGIDHSLPPWQGLDQTPPLQERLGLKLGLAQTHSRLLMRRLLAQGLPLPHEPAAQGVQGHPGRPGATQVRPVLDGELRRRPPDWGRLCRAVPAWKKALPAPLLRAAVRPELFNFSETNAPHGELWLGPDEQGRYWALARTVNEAQAQELARSLHEAACQLQAEAEGLHLVEHLLLRPQDPDAPAPDDGDTAQISLVFSGWTARGADPRFRSLTERTVEREAPAHLRCRLLWLDASQMQAFEQGWQAWCMARHAHCQALLAGEEIQAAVAALDRESARLRALLRELTA